MASSFLFFFFLSNFQIVVHSLSPLKIFKCAMNTKPFYWSMSTNSDSGSTVVIIGTSWSSFFLNVHTPGPLLGRDIPPGKFCVLFCYLFSCLQSRLSSLFSGWAVVDIAIIWGTMKIADFSLIVLLNRQEVCQQIN